MRSRSYLIFAVPFAIAVAAVVSCVSDAGNNITVANDGGADDASAVDSGQSAADGGAGVDGAKGGDTDGGIDAGPACDLTQPFGAPSSAVFAVVNRTKVGIPDLAQYTPRLTPDELTVYYSENPGTIGSQAANSPDIFVATRGGISDSFKPGVTILSVDSQDDDEQATLSADGLTLFFTVDHRNGKFCASHNFCIAKASRASATADFAEAGVAIDDLGSQSFPYIVGNGPEVYYAANNTSTAGWDITTNGGGTLLANVNGPADEYSPALTADDLTIYFSSTRAVDGGTDENIWMATRSSASDPFGAAKLVTELSSPSSEAPGFISADGCRIYFTRDDGAGNGGQNLYFAQKPK